MNDCMICDLYKVFDDHLARPEVDVRDVVSDLVSVLPPRGHGFHKLGIWEQTYKSRA